MMRVELIHVRSPGSEERRSVTTAEAIAGKGLKGDRYYFADGAKPGLALTLIDAEVLGEVGLGPGESLRQITVAATGDELRALIGQRFRVGPVDCFGVEICEPCLHLQKLTRPGILKELVHRAGITADILTDGTISVGDEVVACQV